MRADELRSKRQIAAAFVSRGSPRLLIVLVTAGLIARLAIASWSWADLLMVLVTVGAVGFVEWFLHRFVLHASPDAWMSRRLGTGGGHREHHLDPPALDWLLLRTVDAAIFAILIGVVTTLWAWFVMILIGLIGLVVSGQAMLAPVVTAIVAAHISLAHYEWTHLLEHSSYRPRTRYYRRLSSNHRLHHYRNERYWLGITTNLGDRVLHTYPTHRRDVPLSDTARTLR